MQFSDDRPRAITGRAARAATVLLTSLGALACGARTELGVADPLDANAPDVSAPPDAALCDYGTIVTDVFGATVLWDGGGTVAPGHYRITYIDGCMKYSSSQAWSVNAYTDGPDRFFVLANGSRRAPAPGTVGFLEGQGGFATFEACVSANLAQDVPLEFDFAGGTLGVMLADDPYSDNVPGDDGRNPTYRLSSCP